MYCSECGQSVAGNFCCHCGAPLADVVPPGELLIDWEDSLDYYAVSNAPEVHAAITRAEAAARQGVSGSQLLALADSIATPFTAGISSITVAKIVQPLYAKLGMKTGKVRSELLPLPPGRTLAGVLCALARQGQAIVGVDQQADACALTANLPADLRSMDGKLAVTVSRHPQGTLVTANATIEGQWFDWGKCQSRLDELFQSVRRAA